MLSFKPGFLILKKMCIGLVKPEFSSFKLAQYKSLLLRFRSWSLKLGSKKVTSESVSSSVSSSASSSLPEASVSRCPSRFLRISKYACVPYNRKIPSLRRGQKRSSLVFPFSFLMYKTEDYVRPCTWYLTQKDFWQNLRNNELETNKKLSATCVFEISFLNSTFSNMLKITTKKFLW